MHFKNVLASPSKNTDPLIALLPPFDPFKLSTSISPSISTAENPDCLATPPIVSPIEVILFKTPPVISVTSTQASC